MPRGTQVTLKGQKRDCSILDTSFYNQVELSANSQHKNFWFFVGFFGCVLVTYK